MARFYVPLDVNCQDDPAILRAGPDAELLYLRGLQLAKRLGTDGLIARAHLYRLAADLPAVTSGECSPDEVAKRLVGEELWVEVDDGYVFASWLKHNLSAEELDQRRRDEAERKRKWRESHRTDDGRDAGHDTDATRDTTVSPAGVREAATDSEEKRSELKRSEVSEAAPEAPSPRKRPTYIADTFVVTEEMAAWAEHECPGLDIGPSTQKFVNHWKEERDRQRKNGLKVDWERTWRNWVLSDWQRLPAYVRKQPAR